MLMLCIPKHRPPLVSQLFSLVVGNRLLTAHVGDSRAVMHDGRQGRRSLVPVLCVLSLFMNDVC